MNEINSYLTFKVGDNLFGIPVEHVIEILEFVPLKSKPESLPYILGLIEHRDEVLPLIDTGLKFGQSSITIHEQTCIVVINVFNKATNRTFHVAIVADLVTDVIEVDSAELQVIESDYKPGYVIGAAKHEESLVLMMNVNKVFSDTDVLMINNLVKEKAH
jgi:Chemotaxis signal transduction protein